MGIDALRSWLARLLQGGMPQLSGEEREALHAAYTTEVRRRSHRDASAFCLIAAGVILATIPLDRVRFPTLAHSLVHVRLAGVGGLGIVLALLQTRYGRRQPRALGLLGPCVAGALLQALVFRTGGAASPINVSTNFAILGVALVLPWSAGWSALACLAIVGEYVAGALAVRGLTAGRAFRDDMLVFAAASALTIAISAVRERRRRREFGQQWALAAAHHALRESEARLRTVIADAPVVVFALDRAGMVTVSDGKGLRRLGLSSGELVGRALAEVYPQRAEYFARALEGEAVSWLGSVGEATFECRLTPIRDGNGRVTGANGLAIDLTERRQAEDARLALERKLLETQKLESLGVLAGGIAHDFNNLLVSVLGNASLALADLPENSPTRDRVERIETAARRGSELTRQMLDYAGKGRVMLERVDVNAIIDEMRDLLHVSMPAKATVRYELGHDLPAVEADPTQIRQVVMNLVINASEALGDADGVIAVRTTVTRLGEAELRTTHHAAEAAPGRYLHLEVADTGCGMDAATAAKIFDPFFSTKFAGRGLGLATVLGIVRGHRGGLRVRSAVGRGTTFSVFLPCTSRPARVRRRPAALAPAAGAEASGRTVLVVDDEEDVRAVTAQMLERLGCSVLVAGDGQEGVDVFRAHARVIDAVIIDLTLPRMSGDRVFNEIRGIRPDARVILMSGYNSENVTRRLVGAGPAAFLRKPFSVADLRAIMDRALGAR